MTANYSKLMKVTLGTGWSTFIHQLMAIRGKGYRKYKMGHTGRGNDRREDKEHGETKLQRQARLGLLTKRA